MTGWLPCCCSTLLLLVAAQGHAELFDSDEVLSIDLQGPLVETLRDRSRRAERPFTLMVDGSALEVAVRVRGKSRAEECRFPPLRLNFEDAQADSTVFANLDKLKLVTHCQKTRHFEQNVLEEYAAYRMFARLSEFSHRARLIRVRYVDTSKPGRDPVVRYAFALEPIEQVARRTAAEVQHVPHVVESRLAVEQAALVFVYHYLIANTDWSLVTAQGEQNCCHNGSLLLKDGRNYLVPYDFDLSGFVNPRYARPDPDLPIRRITSRLYRGYCIDGVDVAAAIDAILAAEADLLDMVRDLPDAVAKDADKRLAFLGKFFELARSGGLAERLESSCVG